LLLAFLCCALPVVSHVDATRHVNKEDALNCDLLYVKTFYLYDIKTVMRIADALLPADVNFPSDCMRQLHAWRYGPAVYSKCRGFRCRAERRLW
jgi:hypothetical protein